MIKKIHYVWFGNEEPKWVNCQVNQWRQLCPDFEIIRWNENNTDISCFPWGKQALKDKKWAFVSDLVRLQVLYEQGGWYFDTDVSLYNHPVDMIPVRNQDFVLGYIGICVLGTAVMYATPRHPEIKNLLNIYKNLKLGEYEPNNSIYTKYFIDNVPEFQLSGREWKNDNVHVYPKEMFEVGSFFHAYHMSCHWCCNTWVEKRKRYYIGTNFQPFRWLKMQILCRLRDRQSKFWENYKRKIK